MNKECPKGGQHEIGTDGMHSNRFCKKCFTNESAIYKIEWRPDDWVNPYNKEDRPLLLHDHDGRTFEAGASAMLAVRDKWWVEWVEKNLDDMYPDCGESTKLIKCKDCSCEWEAWQSLKLSLQSSASLKNLMGKFPDLPDVTEVK